jgi:hypothetical protein
MMTVSIAGSKLALEMPQSTLKMLDFSQGTVNLLTFAIYLVPTEALVDGGSRLVNLVEPFANASARFEQFRSRHRPGNLSKATCVVSMNVCLKPTFPGISNAADETCGKPAPPRLTP